jgi:hypothetical protein
MDDECQYQQVGNDLEMNLIFNPRDDLGNVFFRDDIQEYEMEDIQQQKHSCQNINIFFLYGNSENVLYDEIADN